ncbi:MAG: hypothetical protein ACRDQ1_14740 [Sciscionella sp.]
MITRATLTRLLGTPIEGARQFGRAAPLSVRRGFPCGVTLPERSVRRGAR